MRSPASWLELFRALGQALLDVLRAEAADLGHDLGSSGRALGRAVALLGLAAALLFWTLGVLTLAAVEVLAIRLPRWGATLAVAGIFALVVATLAALGWRGLRRLESPGATLKRHLDGHLEWWQERVLVAPEPLAGGGEADESEGGEEP